MHEFIRFTVFILQIETIEGNIALHEKQLDEIERSLRLRQLTEPQKYLDHFSSAFLSFICHLESLTAIGRLHQPH